MNPECVSWLELPLHFNPSVIPAQCKEGIKRSHRPDVLSEELKQRLNRKGLSETAVMLCKLNKSL